MFYFGSWLMTNRDYSMRDYFISLFGLMLSLTGLAAAMSGLTDADKAKAAAVRIFELTERISEIDPLSDDGYMPGIDNKEAYMARQQEQAKLLVKKEAVTKPKPEVSLLQTMEMEVSV